MTLLRRGAGCPCAGSWVVIKVCQGRAREIPLVMWVVTVAFIVYFASEPISGWIGQ